MDDNAGQMDAATNGARVAMERIVAALGADGVKGDAGRMSAALNLAMSSPTMAADDIAAFVVAHVTPKTAATSAAETYSTARAAAAVEGEQRWTMERQEQARQRNSAARREVDRPASDCCKASMRQLPT